MSQGQVYVLYWPCATGQHLAKCCPARKRNYLARWFMGCQQSRIYKECVGTVCYQWRMWEIWGRKKWEEKILLLIQLNCVTGSSFYCCSSICRHCWKQTEPVLRKCGFLKWYSLGTGAYLYREMFFKTKWWLVCRFSFLERIAYWGDTVFLRWNETRIVSLLSRDL